MHRKKKNIAVAGHKRYNNGWERCTAMTFECIEMRTNTATKVKKKKD
jgi:hypothetical protein